LKSRQEEVDYLAKNGVSILGKKTQYSINKGLWGTSVGGKETLTSIKRYLAKPTSQLVKGRRKVTLEFEKGELIAVNGIKTNLQLILLLLKTG
jgi:argininosuccinate synthase